MGWVGGRGRYGRWVGGRSNRWWRGCVEWYGEKARNGSSGSEGDEGRCNSLVKKVKQKVKEKEKVDRWCGGGKQENERGSQKEDILKEDVEKKGGMRR